MSLEFYPDLTSIQPEKRLSAAENLLKSLPDTINSDVEYCLKRLTRGLSSNKDGARQGFATCLTEFYNLYDFNPKDCIDLLHKTSLPMEERERYYARLFGYQAIIISNLFSKLEKQDVESIVQNLIEIFRAKYYIRTAATKVLISLAQSIKDSDLLNYIIKEFLTDVNTPEHVWFVVAVLKGKIADKGWKNDLILHVKNKTKLIEILLNAEYPNSQLHPVYSAILSVLQENHEEMITTEQFWDFIDSSMFNSSHDRKFIGFQVFLLILPALSPEQIPFLFTQNFTRCLINSLKADTYLHKQAQTTVKRLSEIAAENPNIALPLVMQLLGKNGHYKFDSLTNTKTVENILALLTEEGINKFLDYLFKSFFEPTSILESDSRITVVRKWCIDQMALLIRTGSITKQNSWVSRIIQFAVVHGFFVCKEQKNEIIRPIDDSVDRTYIREKLFIMLGNLQKENIWSWKALQFLNESKEFGLKLEIDVDDDIESVRTTCMKRVTSIQKKVGKTQDSQKIAEMKCFESLFIYLYLVMHHDPQEAIDVVPELEKCFDLMFKADDKHNGKKRKLESESNQETHKPVEVLVDILISFMAKSSAALRTLASDIFKTFTPKLTSGSLALLFEVLNANEGIQGAAELFEEDQDDEDETDSDEKENESEIASTTSDEEEVDEELKQKLKEALQVQNSQSDEELSDLDDEQMSKFDEKLTEIFKHKKEIKVVKKNTKETVLHFKLRVLDLIEIFLKTGSSSIIDIIDPLLNLYNNSAKFEEQKALSQKVGSLIGKLCKIKVQADEKVDLCFKSLEQVHQLLRSSSNTSMSPVLMQLAIFLVKVIKQAKPNTPKKPKTINNNLDQVIDIYKKTFIVFLEGKANVRPVIFHDLAEKMPEIAGEMLQHLIPLINEQVKAFPMVSSLEIFSQIIRKQPSSQPMNISPFAHLLTNVLERCKNAPETGPHAMNKERVRTVLKVILNTIRKTSKKEWEVERLRAALDSTLDSDRFKSLSSLSNLKRQIELLLK